jgi:eukaryotic-like serine/threonine-protein kinase
MGNLVGRDIGRYHILEQLGQGGMATVYRAYDSRLERDVAVKIIRVDVFAPTVVDQILKRFEREAKALAHLDDFHIVKIYDFGEYEGAPYLVMQYVPGGTLKDRVGQPWPWRDAVRLIIPLAQALAYAHREGVIHRDIKPANILMTSSDQPLISDFGIAKLLETDEAATLTGTGIGVGTPEYMAPEQWENRVLPQTDVFSLGVVLFELITGGRPYGGDTPASIYRNLLTTPLPALKQAVPGTPSQVDQVIARAMAKDPAQRYATMDEFAAALQRLLDGAPRPAETRKAPAAVRSTPITPPRVTPPDAEATVYHPPVPGGSSQPARPASRPLRRWLIPAVIVLVGMLGFLTLLLWAWNPIALSAGQAVKTASARHAAASQSAQDQPASLPASTITPAPPNDRVRKTDGMHELLVLAGGFTMGSNAYADDEKPAHEVYLDDYYIDQTEVTNAMYALCVAAGKCDPPAQNGSKLRDQYYGNSDYASYPVIFVTWDQASAYCAWAGAALPTEAQWEKAAHGPAEQKYPWGNNLDPAQASHLANFNEIIGDTTQVGRYPDGASFYRALDMAGNVVEWVQDWFGEDYYARSPQQNPTGPIKAKLKVARGGSFRIDADSMRTTARLHWSPSTASNNLGFRCAAR